MTGTRINRSAIKLEAKRAIGIYWKVCILSALIYEAIAWLLELFQSKVIPFLTVAVPQSATQSLDAFYQWIYQYMEQLPGMWDWRYTVISALVAIIIFMVITPLRFSLYEIAMKISGGHDAHLADMRYWFFSGARVLRSIFLSIAVALLSFLWTLLFLIPSAVLILVSFIFPILPAAVIPLQLLGIVLGIAGGIAAAVRTTSYLISYYLLAENPDLTVSQALGGCKALVKGRRGEVFVLFLSFIVWFIISALTYGVLNIFVTPYLNLTVAYYIRAVRDAGDPPPVWNPM